MTREVFVEDWGFREGPIVGELAALTYNWGHLLYF